MLTNCASRFGRGGATLVAFFGLAGALWIGGCAGVEDSSQLSQGSVGTNSTATDLGCGGAGETCCPGSVCEPNMYCGADNTCQACGHVGQTCCPGEVCGPLGRCGENNLCEACGGEGQQCCDNNLCDVGLLCGTQSGTCNPPSLPTNAAPSRCGNAGQPCCRNGTCNTGNTCNSSNVCEACGSEQERCCDGGTCDAGHVCTSSDNTGMCFQCGDPGEYCCSGGTCNGTNYCQDGICQSPSCGGPLQPCCADSYNHCTSGYSCRLGTCVPNSPVPIYCGGVGQPCCQDDICSPPNTCRAGVCVSLPRICVGGVCT